MPSKTSLILNSMGISKINNNLKFGAITEGTKLNNNIGVLFTKVEQEEL